MATIDTLQMQRNNGTVRSGATALPDHNRNYGFIQNVSTSNVLFLRLGSGCSTTVYDLKLSPGDGVCIRENGTITAAGTSMQYTAWER